MSKFFSIPPWTSLRGDVARALVLAMLTALVWCTVYNRWTMASWQTPLTYLADQNTNDVISLFAGIKAASEGHISPFSFNDVPELGAPHVANWNDYPLTEKPLIMLTGWLARAVGIFAAANIALLVAQVLAAVSFYAAARLLGGTWLWSGVGAMIFAFSRYAFAQGEYHLTVTYCWHVPLCLVIAIWVMRREGIEFGTGRFRFALVVALIAGVQNIYYTNMFAQFVLFGGLLQGRRRGWQASLPALAIIGTAAAAFLLMNANTFAYALVHGGNEGAVARSYKWLEVYGLKLVDLVVPPPDHRFGPFAAWGAGHMKEIILAPGELPPTGYLGLATLGALTWLVAASVRRVAGRAAMPLEAWLILWIIVYAGVGGLNGIAGTLGFQLFRATTRYSIFILCLALLFAIRRLSMMKARTNFLIYAAAFLTVVLALWDQTPPVVSAGEIGETARAVASDRAFTEKMEERLPAQAMVFQIPVMDFPESPGPGIGAYDHLRPYLYSHQLRFSFGSDKGRRQEKWQRDLNQFSLRELVAHLESYGFSALYVNLNVFSDKGAALAKSLQGIGRGDMFTSDQGDLLCVFLQPSAQPVMPDPY